MEIKTKKLQCSLCDKIITEDSMLVISSGTIIKKDYNKREYIISLKERGFVCLNCGKKKGLC